VGHHGPIRGFDTSLQVATNGPASSEFEGDLESLELIAHEMNDAIRIPGGTRRLEEPNQELEYIVLIHSEGSHEATSEQ
jgi:hypothetical protein